MQGRTAYNMNNSDWVETVGIFWIDNWAYIDDLTPKEE